MKRIRKALEYLPPEDSKNEFLLYDLFCDHGKLGLLLHELGFKVCFNDLRAHLVKEVQMEFSRQFPNDEARFLTAPAQNIEIEKSAWVYMLGVGGHLLNECLAQWLSKGHVIDQSFILIPTYYQVELRAFLALHEFFLVAEDFVWDKGRGYEVLVVTKKEREGLKRVELFSRKFWVGQCKADPRAREYLLSKYQGLSKQRVKKDFEANYFQKLGDFLHT